MQVRAQADADRAAAVAAAVDAAVAQSGTAAKAAAELVAKVKMRSGPRTMCFVSAKSACRLRACDRYTNT